MGPRSRRRHICNFPIRAADGEFNGDITMKIINLLASTALVATSFTPLFVAPAFASILPSSATTSTMASTCAADLAPYAGVMLHNGTLAYFTEVVETGQIDGPATEVAGSRIETPGSRFGTGTATYSNLSISGSPFRTGGSVNMFGDQVATHKNWAGSEYDFTANYSTTTTVSYACHVTQLTETYVPAVPGHVVEGYYVNNGTNPSGGGGSCAGLSSNNPHFGEDLGNCIFMKTADAVEGTPESWTLNAPVDRTDLTHAHTVDETNTATGNGHEVNGGPFTQIGSWLAGKVVICISPKKLPGTWTTQNGYIGNKCNTAYFYTAPWGGGSQTSNGTYISVPGV